MRRVPAPWIIGFLVWLSSACGPSLRMVHQSDGYFERCNSADFEPRIPAGAKQACWAQWLQHYTIGQPPERVRYAHERIAALESGVITAPLPGTEQGGGETRTVSAPVVTDASESSFMAEAMTSEAARTVADAGVQPVGPDGGAAVATEDGGIVPIAPPPPMRHSPPRGNNACNSTCNPRWNACIKRCENDSLSCVRTCELEYRTCSNGCF